MLKVHCTIIYSVCDALGVKKYKVGGGRTLYVIKSELKEKLESKSNISMKINLDDELFRISEVAKNHRVPRQMIRLRIVKNILGAINISRSENKNSWRIPASSLDEYKKNNKFYFRKKRRRITKRKGTDENDNS